MVAYWLHDREYSIYYQDNVVHSTNFIGYIYSILREYLYF